jgi:hypothetical protein
MNNFLEKWLANGNQPSVSGKDGANRDDVLAMLRRDREAAAAEVFDQMCVCAVHDRPFITRYTKQPSGKFRATECIKVQSGSAQSEKSAGKLSTLSVGEIDGRYPPCPWCGCTSNVHYNCRCGGVVCGGRVKGRVFRCRRSCGAEWIPGASTQEIQGTSLRRDSKDWKSSPRTALAEPMKPVGRLLLGK